jgi:hypothetical protein
MNELKPCPFCGGILEHTGLADKGKTLSFGMRCTNNRCAAEIVFPWWIVNKHQNDTIDFLNRRADEWIEPDFNDPRTLPKEMQEVIGCEIVNGVMLQKPTGGVYCEDGSFFYQGRKVTVTHWSPIPEPPRENVSTKPKAPQTV